MSTSGTLEIQHELKTANSIVLKIKYPNLISYQFQMEIKLSKQNISSLNANQAAHYCRKFYTTPSQVVINDLSAGTMYKIIIGYKWANREPVKKNIFFATPMANVQGQAQQQEQQYNNDFGAFRRTNTQISHHSRQQSSTRNIHSSNSNTMNRNRYNSSNRVSSITNAKKIKKNSNQQLSNSQLLMKMIGRSQRLGSDPKMHKLVLEARNCRNLDQFINQKQNKRTNNREQLMNKKMLIAKGMLLFDQIYKDRQGHNFFKNDWFMGPFYSYNYNQQDIRKH